jgi:DEAD/DEAH box helicase domain-containing protein
MSSVHEALAPRAFTTLDCFRQILGQVAARNNSDDVLTCVRQIAARDAVYRPMPEWIHPELREAYGAKGIQQLYSHQAATAELAHDGRNVVVVTPTASGKTSRY